MKKIFVSHSSKDRIIVDEFVEKILIQGCNISESEIFCTSIEGLGIKTGLDFRNHIRENLLACDYSILLISENYKQSDICLNEMGALWAQDSVRVMPIILPNISFESIGTLFNVKQAAKIEDSSSLDELFEEFSEKYSIQKKIARWNKSKDLFLKFIQINSKGINIIQPQPFEFFNQFVKENANINHILLNCHPSLLDCKKIFSEKFASQYFEKYCHAFSNLDKTQIEPFYPSRKYFKVTKTDTIELLRGINKIAGGLVTLAEKGVFKYDIDFYKVDFLKNENDESGISMKVFCYINDHWIFIPKPYF